MVDFHYVPFKKFYKCRHKIRHKKNIYLVSLVSRTIETLTHNLRVVGSQPEADPPLAESPTGPTKNHKCQVDVCGFFVCSGHNFVYNLFNPGNYFHRSFFCFFIVLLSFITYLNGSLKCELGFMYSFLFA